MGVAAALGHKNKEEPALNPEMHQVSLLRAQRLRSNVFIK